MLFVYSVVPTRAVWVPDREGLLAFANADYTHGSACFEPGPGSLTEKAASACVCSGHRSGHFARRYEGATQSFRVAACSISINTFTKKNQVSSRGAKQQTSDKPGLVREDDGRTHTVLEE